MSQESQPGDDESTRKLHVLAAKTLQAVVVAQNPAHSAIPDSAFAALKGELQAVLSERVAFEHLCVLWARLKEGGLPRAAAQMLELASIGLKPAELEAAVTRSEQLRGAAKSIQPGKPSGATARAPTSRGASFRSKRKI
jgi:hypothetical protein